MNYDEFITGCRLSGHNNKFNFWKAVRSMQFYMTTDRRLINPMGGLLLLSVLTAIVGEMALNINR